MVAIPGLVDTAVLRAGGGGRGGGRHELAWLAVPVGFAVSSLPLSWVVARVTAGVDLRRHGSGTVSASALYEVAGFGPLAVAALLEVAKGAVGPLLARRHGTGVRAAAAAASVAGHTWSPWSQGTGGGLSPAIGAMLVGAPAGAVLLFAGMAGGHFVGETAVGVALADTVLVPVARRAHGDGGGRMAAAVLVPMLVERLLGDGPPKRRSASTYLWRLLADRDARQAGDASRAGQVVGALR